MQQLTVLFKLTETNWLGTDADQHAGGARGTCKEIVEGLPSNSRLPQIKEERRFCVAEENSKSKEAKGKN